jgi:hypothetical protein
MLEGYIPWIRLVQETPNVCDEDHHSDYVGAQFHNSRQIPLASTPTHTLTHTPPFKSYPVWSKR